MLDTIIRSSRKNDTSRNFRIWPTISKGMSNSGRGIYTLHKFQKTTSFEIYPLTKSSIIAFQACPTFPRIYNSSDFALSDPLFEPLNRKYYTPAINRSEGGPLNTIPPPFIPSVWIPLSRPFIPLIKSSILFKSYFVLIEKSGTKKACLPCGSLRF